MTTPLFWGAKKSSHFVTHTGDWIIPTSLLETFLMMCRSTSVLSPIVWIEFFPIYWMSLTVGLAPDLRRSIRHTNTRNQGGLSSHWSPPTWGLEVFRGEIHAMRKVDAAALLQPHILSYKLQVWLPRGCEVAATSLPKVRVMQRITK